MNVRDLEARDLPILREWHEKSGFDYPFPDLENPLYRVRVEVDENDRPIQAMAAKTTVELFFLLDSTWRNPRWRLEAFSQLHEDMRQQLEQRGMEDGNCWLPPEIEKSFGRRLQRLFGWVPSRWRSYSRKVRKP